MVGNTKYRIAGKFGAAFNLADLWLRIKLPIIIITNHQ